MNLTVLVLPNLWGAPGAGAGAVWVSGDLTARLVRSETDDPSSDSFAPRCQTCGSGTNRLLIDFYLCFIQKNKTFFPVLLLTHLSYQLCFCLIT